MNRMKKFFRKSISGKASEPSSSKDKKSLQAAKANNPSKHQPASEEAEHASKEAAAEQHIHQQQSSVNGDFRTPEGNYTEALTMILREIQTSLLRKNIDGSTTKEAFDKCIMKQQWSSEAIKIGAKIENVHKQKALPKGKQIPTVEEGMHDFAVSGVYFTCPTIGPEVLPKNEIEEKIKSFLYDQLEHKKDLTACLIIHTLNKNKSRVEKGIETLTRCLTLIIDEPSEEKYRKIRFSNRFHDRIVNLEGAIDFLLAAGFTRRVSQTDDGEEEYFVLDEEFLDLEKLQMLKEALSNAKPILPGLDRNVKLLKPAQVVGEVKLPQEFFSLTLEELKREQKSRTKVFKLLGALRTKEMRERDEMRKLLIYKFCLIRVRFPDGIILQGTFSVHENLSRVREFVADNLKDPFRKFDLVLPGGVKIEDDSKNLLQMKFVPAVILNFLAPNDSSSDDIFLKT